MNVHYAIEKFTRCPHCHSFSLRGLNPNNTKRVMRVSSGNIFVCYNCGTQYVLQGNTLKKIDSSFHKKKQETKKKVPVRSESKTINRTTVILVPFICLIIIGIIFLFLSGNRHPGQNEVSQLRVEKKTISIKPKIEFNKDVVDGINLMAAVIGTKGANEDSQKIDLVIDSEKVNYLEANNIDKLKNVYENTQSEEVPKNNNRGPISYKIFDFSWIKLRKTSPHHSDKSFRWYFSRKTIAINRSKTQKVYIAGDYTGKSNWAVDDEIIINGEKIQGFSKEMTRIGYIPELKRVAPYDITHLVPSDREVILDIRLVDYGIFWGNTSLFIVIQ